jgi:hypothetical protein
MLVAKDRFEKLAAGVESGAIKDLEALSERLAECHAAFAHDEWNWVAKVWEERFGTKPHELTGAQLAAAAEKLLSCKTSAVKQILADAEKEFSEMAQIGFGVDGDEAARKLDFEVVRGTFEKNEFVAEMNAELSQVEKRVMKFAIGD